MYQADNIVSVRLKLKGVQYNEDTEFECTNYIYVSPVCILLFKDTLRIVTL